MSAYQTDFAKLSQENEELRRKLQDLNNDFSRRLAESEKKYVALAQEYEKLRLTANALGQ
jgi:cell division protein FtsB